MTVINMLEFFSPECIACQNSNLIKVKGVRQPFLFKRVNLLYSLNLMYRMTGSRKEDEREKVEEKDEYKQYLCYI